MGIDILIEFPLNIQTAATPPEEFVREILVKRMNTGFIASGKDLSFGKGGKGNSRLLTEMSAEYGYQVCVIDKVYYEDREISSTYVREMVEKGDMAGTRALLGRYYSFEGVVEHGNRLGRRLGMPTMNLYPRPEKLLPPWGVYYSRLHYEGGTYPGITNIGRKPTVNQTDIVSVETYLERILLREECFITWGKQRNNCYMDLTFYDLIVIIAVLVCNNSVTIMEERFEKTY